MMADTLVGEGLLPFGQTTADGISFSVKIQVFEAGNRLRIEICVVRNQNARDAEQTTDPLGLPVSRKIVFIRDRREKLTVANIEPWYDEYHFWASLTCSGIVRFANNVLNNASQMVES